MISTGLKPRPASRGRQRPSQTNISMPGQASPMPRMAGDKYSAIDSSISERVRANKVGQTTPIFT